MPSFLFKRTTQLSPQEKIQIRTLFREIFDKEKSTEHFDSEFLLTPLGYSFHSLLVADGAIVGCYSSIPYRYSFFGEDCLFALSVDTMIRKDFRGLDNLKKLADLVYLELQNVGVDFVFGFPNDNIYKIRKRFFGWQDIGTLDYFVLPLRLGAFISHGDWLNIPSQIGYRTLNRFGRLLGSRSTEPECHIRILTDGIYERHRYGFFDRKYLKADLGRSCSAIYRLEVYKRIRVAYILDVTVLSRSAIQAAVNFICSRHCDEIDAIVYVGNLRCRPINLIKVPKRFEPKREYMSGKLLSRRLVDDRIFDLRNWRVNLSNFDVV